MKLFVGLGNIGKEYENTRHNAGFMAIDIIASRLNISFSESKFKGLLAQTTYKGEKILLLKPTTYMNLSGEAVRAVMDFYKIPIEDILILYDDKDTAVGKIRVRYQGSAGGHNGIKNIIAHLHSEKFNRIRIGIGSNDGKVLADFVLGKIDKETFKDLSQALERAADAAIESIDHKFDEVMSHYNQK